MSLRKGRSWAQGHTVGGIIGFKFITACPGALLDPEGEDSRALKIKRREKRAAEGEGRVRVRGALPVRGFTLCRLPPQLITFTTNPFSQMASYRLPPGKYKVPWP